jgi:hypothetical protein
MQDSSHLTIILCSSVIKIVISQKQKVNRKNNYNKPVLLCVTIFLLFMFSKKIIIKLFKIAPENFHSHLTFVAICIHGTLENFIIN